MVFEAGKCCCPCSEPFEDERLEQMSASGSLFDLKTDKNKFKQ